MASFRAFPAALTAAALGALALSVPVAATTGTDSPYSLGVSALLGKDGTTDVYATTTSSSASVAAPSSYKEFQLKSFDQDGVTVVYTKNFHNLAAPGGVADVQRTDLVRHQPLNVHALAQTAQTVSTQVVDAKAIVNLRPELELGHLQAPATVYVKDHFTVSANLAETNGDTGATSTVQILNGATALDTIQSVRVAAGTSTGLAFDLSFATPGTYHLTMQVSNVAPGEWDTLHNTLQFTVVVIEPYKTLGYQAGYWRESHSYNEDTNYGFYVHDNEDQEWFSASYHAADFGAIASQPVHVKLGADGSSRIDVNIPVNNSGSSFKGCDFSSNTCVHGFDSGNGTQIYLDHWAGRFSRSLAWCWYYDCNYSYQRGTLIDATQSLTAYMDMATSAGVHYGGTLNLGISKLYEYSWDFTNSLWGWYSWHDYGYNRAWSGYGSGTTTWN